jgi:hypothetical protein
MMNDRYQSMVDTLQLNGKGERTQQAYARSALSPLCTVLATDREFTPRFPDLLRHIGVSRRRPSYLSAEPVDELFVHDPLNIVRRLCLAESRQNRTDFHIIFVLGRPDCDKSNRVRLPHEPRHLRVAGAIRRRQRHLPFPTAFRYHWWDPAERFLSCIFTLRASQCAKRAGRVDVPSRGAQRCRGRCPM